ncbi:MAG: hypothetical protein ACR2OE_12540, partial [Thermomicrobiales bacterium]
LNTIHRDKLEALVAALLERETLDGPEVTEIFGSPPVKEDIEAGMELRQAARRSSAPSHVAD